MQYSVFSGSIYLMKWTTRQAVETYVTSGSPEMHANDTTMWKSITEM